MLTSGDTATHSIPHTGVLASQCEIVPLATTQCSRGGWATCGSDASTLASILICIFLRRQHANTLLTLVLTLVLTLWLVWHPLQPQHLPLPRPGCSIEPSGASGIFEVLGDLAADFGNTSKLIHLGGDEVPYPERCWSTDNRTTKHSDGTKSDVLCNRCVNTRDDDSRSFLFARCFEDIVLTLLCRHM